MNKPGFFAQLAQGFSAYFEALNFLVNKRLWTYMLYPLVMSILLIWGGFALADHLAVKVENLISELTGTNGRDLLGFMSGFLHTVLTIIIKIFLFFIFSSLSKFVVLILMSPVMSLLSDRTEEILTGEKIPFDSRLFIRNFVRGIGIALRNTVIQAGIIILCLLICWIPLLGWISPAFLLVTSYYFYGFSMIDYVNERRGLSIRESVRLVREHKMLSVVNGFVFSILFAIPFAGVLIAPVLAPVAACIAMHRLQLKK